MKFEPKQWVLVRDSVFEHWKLSTFSHYEEDKKDYPYFTISGNFAECLPYEGNEKLLGTNDPYFPPYVPQEGDFVFLEKTEGKEWIYIQKQGINSTDRYCSYSISMDMIFTHEGHVCSDNEIKVIRPATEGEKIALLHKLHEEGLDWDADNKKIVKIVNLEYEPEFGDRYYFPSYICGMFTVHSKDWIGDNQFDSRIKERGWAFRTEEDCRILCDKLNEVIKNVYP